MVAIQRLPRLFVGPWYFTTAQAVEPLTCVPVQLGVLVGFVMVLGVVVVIGSVFPVRTWDGADVVESPAVLRILVFGQDP
jgi:hypothetical protein